MSKSVVKEQKLITSMDDMVELGIIDWHRVHGCWKSELEGMRVISSWFINNAVATRIECDLRNFPIRADFPEWEHTGLGHIQLARRYWNCYQTLEDAGELYFGDEPDFYGKFKSGSSFWGDFGKVSASAFSLSACRKLKDGDLWISVLDYKTQIIIEPLESIQALWSHSTGLD